MSKHPEDLIEKREQELIAIFHENTNNARHHELNRWRYTHPYYLAFVAAFVYIAGIWADEKGLETNEAWFALAVSILLFFAGLASFLHLLHANISYKTYIRSCEFIARDWGLIEGVEKYRDKENKNFLNHFHYAYLGLPLRGVPVRDWMGLIRITSALCGLSLIASIFFFLELFEIQWTICLILLGSIVGLGIFALVVWWMVRHKNQTEKEAEKHLEARDPKRRNEEAQQQSTD